MPIKEPNVNGNKIDKTTKIKETKTLIKKLKIDKNDDVTYRDDKRNKSEV